MKVYSCTCHVHVSIAWLNGPEACWNPVTFRHLIRSVGQFALCQVTTLAIICLKGLHIAAELCLWLNLADNIYGQSGIYIDLMLAVALIYMRIWSGIKSHNPYKYWQRDWFSLPVYLKPCWPNGCISYSCYSSGFPVRSEALRYHNQTTWHLCGRYSNIGFYVGGIKILASYAEGEKHSGFYVGG